MTRLEELDNYHGRLAHEFNRIAHNDFGWCVKGSGYESLFKGREGAMKVIGSHFTAETLWCRSWPDYYLWGRNFKGEDRFWFVEIKGPAYISPDYGDRPRVRIEAYQALLLNQIYRLMGMKTIYVFMWINEARIPDGVVCPVNNLPVEEICETQTFREKWCPDLRDRVRLIFKTLYPNLPTSPVTDPKRGSADPFLAFDHKMLLSHSTPIYQWFKEQGPQKLSDHEHIAWEGREAHTNWRSFFKA